MFSPLQYYFIQRLQKDDLSLTDESSRLGVSLDEITNEINILIRNGMPITIINSNAHLDNGDQIQTKTNAYISHSHYYVTTSTQNIALNYVPRANKFIVISADFQSQGRGQHGKNWYSSYGKNILMSAIIPDLNIELPWSLLSGYILRNWLAKRFYIQDITVKWPNDIMIGDLKLCGILHEAHRHRGYWVMGIGLNVHSDTKAKHSISQPNITLEEIVGSNLRRSEILEELITTLYNFIFSKEIIENIILDFPNRYMSYDYFLNKPIYVTQQQQTIRGIGRGINQYGQYLISTFDGNIEKISSSSIKLERRTQ